MTQRSVVQGRAQARGAALLWLVVAGFVVALATQLGNIAGIGACAVVCCGLIAISVQCYRCGFVLTESGITARGIMRNRFARWDEVDGFKCVETMGSNYGYRVGVKLTSGAWLTLSTLAVRSPNSKFAQSTIATLENYKSRYGSPREN